MEFRVERIGDTSGFTKLDLCERAKRSAPGRRTEFYRLCEGQDDLALLFVDPIPEYDELVLYEIFVTAKARNRGLGRHLLLFAENLARCRGLTRLSVRPHPLGAGMNKQNLIAWYKRRGFTEGPHGSEQLFKMVLDRQQEAKGK